jgi:hypothetical protein
MGDFAGIDHQSLAYVQSHRLVAFFDKRDRKGRWWRRNYSGRTIELRKEYRGAVHGFNATIVDTCADTDCDGCCSQTSRPWGFLVDMEFFTVSVRIPRGYCRPHTIDVVLEDGFFIMVYGPG